jgi:hypothetical protein
VFLKQRRAQRAPLLSPSFLSDHCFHVVAAAAADRIGIAFEPTGDRRRVAEIAGTLWINRRTAELTQLEYGYVNIPADQRDGAGGALEFVRFSSGAWAISRWNIRMPILERVPSTDDVRRGARTTETRVVELQVYGGELLLARRGRDTLWVHGPLRLTGTLRDSVSDTPIDGARVELMGAGIAATTDAAGRFDIENVVPGEYAVTVRTRSLDSVKAEYHSALVFADSAIDVTLRVPSAKQIAAAFCGGAARDHPGIVLGVAAGSSDSVLPTNTVIVAEWTEVSVRDRGGKAAVENSLHRLETRTDAKHSFRFCGVPIATAVTLRVRDTVLTADATIVTIPSNARVARVELILRHGGAAGAAFSGVVLVDSTRRAVENAHVSIDGSTLVAVTNARGEFRLSNIPVGRQRILVRRLGFGPLDTTLMFTANQRVEREIFLTPVVLLDSVVTNASAVLPSFEEHRRIGLGTFYTRADLAKREGQTVSSLMAEMPGVGVLRGRGSRAWLASGRGTQSLTGSGSATLDASDVASGAHSACYARVYLDNQLVYGGRSGEPLFDLSTISSAQIEAIEYYKGPSQTPLRYSTSNSAFDSCVPSSRKSSRIISAAHQCASGTWQPRITFAQRRRGKPDRAARSGSVRVSQLVSNRVVADERPIPPAA